MSGRAVQWGMFVMVLAAPFVLAMLIGPGMGSIEVAVWLGCLLLLALVPSAVRSRSGH